MNGRAAWERQPWGVSIMTGISVRTRAGTSTTPVPPEPLSGDRLREWGAGRGYDTGFAAGRWWALCIADGYLLPAARTPGDLAAAIRADHAAGGAR